MDSGNSGSLQSSSGGGDGGGGGGGGGGGDEVYESRTQSISSFLNPPTHFNLIPILQPPPPSSHHHQPPATFLDPSSESFFSQPLNPNPNPMYNIDSSYTSFESTQTQALFNSKQDPYFNPIPVDENISHGPGAEQVNKNPKKRTRASRRAPTTVLTTDTTNFRQMVQEFTGIPAAPFSSSTSFPSPYSRRLDLYGGGTVPLHPLRPSAQKIQLQQPSYLNSNTASASASASTSNFQLPSSDSHGFQKQPLNLSNLQNPMFPFQSLSQTTLPQQLNATESDKQRSEASNALLSSSSTFLKRWRGEDEHLINYEGGKAVAHDDVATSRSDGDHIPVPGNEDSWVCPSD